MSENKNKNARMRINMLWVSFILFLVVFLFTGREIRERQSYVTDQMLGRGSLMIDVFDSSIRTGLRSKSGVMLQPLLEELANTPDIIFITLIMPDGTIIAHSDVDRLGEVLLFDKREVSYEELGWLNVSDKVQAHELPLENAHVFATYRSMPLMRVTRDPNSSPILLIGQDITPVLKAREQGYINALLMGGLVFLFALSAQYAFMRSQKEVEARQARLAAEKLADQMLAKVQSLEKEVRRREKLAAVGDLAAGVAHELRNPLSSIKGYATFFAEHFDKDSSERKSAQIMAGEVDRLNRAITDLIDVAKPTNVHLLEVNLTILIADILELIKQDTQKNQIQVQFIVPQKFPKVWLDPDRIRQALLNFFLNAIDAMGNSSTKILKVELELLDPQNYSLEISDTGCGIDEGSLSRIFDPYFTTKAQGTGLGLVITHKILEAHDASLTLSSKLNEGTSIIIKFAVNPEVTI